MSNNIDQGLDAIISGGSISRGGAKRRPRVRKSAASTKTLGKALAAASKATARAKKVSKTGQAAALPTFNPIASARRVVVSNMPRDVDETAVRAFFSDKVGKISKIQGTYTENGKSTGSFTITYVKPGMAQKTLEKFNNEPVDQGKQRLSVNILIDGSIAQPAKSLSERIGGTSKKATPATAAKAAATPKRARRRAHKAGACDVDMNPATKVQGKAKIGKPKQRSATELDAEMSEYFADGEKKNEISV